MTRHEQCENCRFVEIIKPADVTYAECHKNAPGMSPDDGSSWWPAERLDSPKAWCGDWRETAEAAAKWEASRAKRWAELMDVHGRIPGTVVHPLCGRPIGDNAILTCHAPRGHTGDCWASR